MITRFAVLPAFALIAALCLSCGGDDHPQGTATSAADDAGRWEQVTPETSGAFPAAPGSFDQPVWQPDRGMFPQGLMPIIGFR